MKKYVFQRFSIEITITKMKSTYFVTAILPIIRWKAFERNALKFKIHLLNIRVQKHFAYCGNDRIHPNNELFFIKRRNVCAAIVPEFACKSDMFTVFQWQVFEYMAENLQ